MSNFFKFFKVLSIIANVAIIGGLIKDTYEKVSFRRDRNLTNLENDEV